MSNELFYNVSYFNIITLLVILTALIFFLFDTGFSYFVLYLSELELIRSLLCNLKPYTSYISSTVLWFYRVLFYFLIIESFYSFGRAIGRMSFYFQKKIELQKWIYLILFRYVSATPPIDSSLMREKIPSQ